MCWNLEALEEFLLRKHLFCIVFYASLECQHIMHLADLNSLRFELYALDDGWECSGIITNSQMPWPPSGVPTLTKSILEHDLVLRFVIQIELFVMPHSMKSKGPSGWNWLFWPPMVHVSLSKILNNDSIRFQWHFSNCLLSRNYSDSQSILSDSANLAIFV